MIDINKNAVELFLKLRNEQSEFLRIEGSDEPEGVIRFKTGQAFYFSLNPMTPDWSVDSFEYLDQDIDNELILIGDGSEKVKMILSKINFIERELDNLDD